MFKDSSERSEADWLKNIQPLGLCERITSKHAYDEAIRRNLLRAFEWVRANPTLHPALGYIRGVHQIVFADVHPWAGELRPPGTLPVGLGGSHVSADATRVPRELAVLQAQTRELADGPWRDDPFGVVAFSHARFERIHPFLDGNGRVGRLLADAQLAAVLGPDFPPEPIDRKTYLAALRLTDRNLLGPLAAVLRSYAGQPPSARAGVILSPFSIGPRVDALEDGGRLTVAAEVELTRRPADLLRRVERRLGDGGGK